MPPAFQTSPINAPATATPPSQSRRTLILILAFLSAFAPLTTDMYLPAFAQMAASFNVEAGRIQGTLTAFFLGMAAGQLLYGPILDRWGRRIPLLGGVTVYLLATLGCLLSTNVEMFTVFRVFQAIGGCAGIIVARAVVSDLFDPVENARTMSLLMMIVTLAPAVAPLFGGWILHFAPWQAIFVALLVYGALCWVLAWMRLPETMPVSKRQPISMRSMVRTYAGLLAQPSFRVPAVVGGLGLSTIFCYITGSAFVFIKLYGLSEQQYATVFGVNALGIMAASQLNRLLLRRWPVHKALSFGLTVNLSAGLLVLAAVALGGSVWLFALPLWFCVGSMGLIGSNAAALAMSASGPRAGSASALVGTLQFVFASIFSALVAVTQNGTAYPMAIAMVTAPAIAAVIWGFRSRVARP